MTTAQQTPPAPVKIQLALQGGGARLCGLLAALEAVQELERNGVVHVTRLAGTSAGAIGAALFAADVDFAQLRQRIIDNRAKLLRMLPRPTVVTAFWSLANGRPMVDMAPIRGVLASIFKDRNVSRFADLRVPLIVLATDLTNSRSHPHDNDEDDVVNAVLNSCAIPFYFRGPGKKNGGDLLVDGGICENFPVDVLRSFEHDSGPVLGISFAPRKPGETPSSIAGFARALLDAAMDNSVRRAQRQLGRDRVHSITTDIGTFDFERALGYGMDDRYVITRTEAKEFFQAFAACNTLETAAANKPTVVVQSDREDFDSDTTLQAHADLYAAQHSGVMMNYEEARMVVRSGGFVASRPDALMYRLRFGAANGPLECIRVVVVQEEEFTFLRTLRTEVVDRKFRPRPTIDLHARDKNRPDDRSYLLFFNPPIQPADADGPFTLGYSHHIVGLLSNLAKNGMDTLSYELSRTVSITPRVTLIAVLPKTHPGYSMRESADTTSNHKGRLMSPAELNQVSQELTVDPDQYIVGWVGIDIEPSSEFATELFAPGY